MAEAFSSQKLFTCKRIVQFSPYYPKFDGRSGICVDASINVQRLHKLSEKYTACLYNCVMTNFLRPRVFDECPTPQ